MSVKTVAFVDSRVGDIASLIASNSQETVWFTLNEEEDGVDQMRRIIGDFSDLDSLQIISHGSIGTLYLGSTVLNSNSLSSYQAHFQEIGASLNSTGDILLYGCNVAKGEVGLSFVNALADITGAEVAASNDETGSTELGGDWMLERTTGIIHTASMDVSSESFIGILDNTGSNTDQGASVESFVGNGSSNYEYELIGGNSDDILRTTKSDNILTGGGGVDRFVFIDQLGAMNNRVTDLSAGDILHFTTLVSINQILYGSGASTNQGVIEYLVNGKETILYLGLDQVLGADASIVLENFSDPTQLLALGNVLVVDDANVLAGSPLTGTVSDSVTKDLYLGLSDVYLKGFQSSAFNDFHVTDLVGNNKVVAQNMTVIPGEVSYISSGINSSSFTFGNGDIWFSSLIDQGYYAKGINGGSLTSGSGSTVIKVTAVEAYQSAFIYAVTGISGWSLDAGAGMDTLDVTVIGSRSETFSSIGVSGSQLNFGADNDTARIDVSNVSGSGESRAVSDSRIDLGDGNDTLAITSTGYGIEWSTLLAGLGNDRIEITSSRDTLRDSEINVGDGNDVVSLFATGPNNTELFNSTVQMGQGNDELDLRFAINSLADGGQGDDILRLRDTQNSYSLAILTDTSFEITRPDNKFFKLIANNFESIQYGSGDSGSSYEGSPLTGFLSGTSKVNDLYYGSGNSAAIENLVVHDLTGNDRVVAENLTETGGFSSYFSNGIANSAFTFGDGDISFNSKINQGYYATAVSGGSLSMGFGGSYINIQAVEDFPQDRLGFYYSVTGASNWTLDAGDGRDVLNVVVRGSKTETFSSYGVVSGSISLGGGNDIANITVINLSGTGESIGIHNVARFDLGDGNNRATVISTGYGVKGSTVTSGNGVDVLDVTSNLDAISNTTISTGDGDDSLFAKSAGGNSADLIDTIIDLGGGDDYIDVRIAIDSTIDGGIGYDVLRLRDTESSYSITHLADGAVLITRPQDQFFNLVVNNVEQIMYGASAIKPYYSGSPLTGFLSGTLAGHDTYYGSGLSAAIKNLTVRDTYGNDNVIAENLSSSGRAESYISSAIASSSFAFGDDFISFAARINQGYYATAFDDGDLTMGSGDSRVDIQAVEDYPEERFGFIYGVTGINSVDFDAGAGQDILNVVVSANRNEVFASTGINAGKYALGEGHDLVNVSITNLSGTRESVAIFGATVELGGGDDVMTVYSTGSGIISSSLSGQDGNDFLAVRSILGALQSTNVHLGQGNDKLFLESEDIDQIDLINSVIDMGSGDDYVEIRSARNSTINGGDGYDTIRLSGPEQSYVLEALDDESMRVFSVVHQTEALTLLGFERIVFGPTIDLGQATFEVQGLAQVYQTLSIAMVIADPEGFASSEMSYQWQSSMDGFIWFNVGSNGTFTIREQDQDAMLRGVVSYFDLAGNYCTVSSLPTSQIIAPTQAPAPILQANNTLISSVYALTDETSNVSIVNTEYTGVFGNANNNEIEANTMGNHLDGGAGDDRLLGNVGVDVLVGGEGDDWIDGGDGNDLIIGGSGPGDDVYTGGNGIDTVKYTSATSTLLINLELGIANGVDIDNDTLLSIENIIGGQSDDLIIGDSGANKLDGYTGDDALFGGLGNDFIDGGAGLDYASFTGLSSQYSIQIGSNTTILDTESSRDGTDSLINVERLIFADTNIALDFKEIAGQAYRIYEAVLGRAPDLEGLGYWINDMDNGVSLTTIAQGFIASPEFQGKYGANPSYETYINLLYNNILERDPDPDGLNYWVSNMRNDVDTPAAVLASFSEGFENTANVAPDIANGIYYTAWIT